MAILPYDQPDLYQLAYNDNVFVWKTSQPTPTKRFQVIVIDSGLNSLAQLIVYPVAMPLQSSTPNRAYVDVSRIVQSQVSKDIEIPLPSHNAFLQNPNSHLEYYVIIKEQDIDPVTGAYEILPNWYFFKEKSVWNGVQDLADWITFGPSTYLMTTSGTTTKFLSEAPTTREIKSDQSAFLYLIATEDNAPAKYELRTYDGFDATGSLLNDVSVENPHATTLTGSWKFRYLRMPVGTYDIPYTNPSLYSSGSPLTVLNGAKSYTIRLQSVHANISETITFNIDKECFKFDGVRLHWLNRLGGIDSFNFNLKSSESTGAKRKNYRQQHHTWTGYTWEYDKSSRGKTEYDIQTTKKIKVNTEYLSDANSALMESLFGSPQIYQEINNVLYGVNIGGKGKSIEKKTSLNDKLCQYTFDLEYSLLNHRQRG